MSKKVMKDETVADEIMLDDAMQDEVLQDDTLQDASKPQEKAKDEVKQKSKIVNKKEVGFTKNQITRSKKYAKYRDILQSELNDEATYTHMEIVAVIEEFKKGGV